MPHISHITPETKEAWPLHSSLTVGDTPHSSLSEMGGLLSAATAPSLTTRAVLADVWSCMSPSDRFLWQSTPGDKQQKEWKTTANDLGQCTIIYKGAPSLYLLHLSFSSALLVANLAVLSSLSLFPQCILWTLRGWAAGEQRRGEGQHRHKHTSQESNTCLLQPTHHTAVTAPSLNTQHLHTYLVISSKD